VSKGHISKSYNHRSRVVGASFLVDTIVHKLLANGLCSPMALWKHPGVDDALLLSVVPPMALHRVDAPADETNRRLWAKARPEAVARQQQKLVPCLIDLELDAHVGGRDDAALFETDVPEGAGHLESTVHAPILDGPACRLHSFPLREEDGLMILGQLQRICKHRCSPARGEIICSRRLWRN